MRRPLPWWLRRAGDCIPALGPCTVTEDCCEGYTCIDGVCGINPA